ncbi:MAG TPA: hypothetical protein IAC14_01995 [Candidatus Scybalomonas excrementigallinarum]|nr:hypothetical protein [Candidatus Scybalomonas excrementigallinarum]
MKIMTNQSKGFYQIMGKVFGSREIERETKDRIYDDDEKEWYIELDKEKNVLAFVSIKDKTIKNIYGTPDKLEKILTKVYPIVTTGIVTKKYVQIYIKCGYKVEDLYSYFVKIYGGYTDEHK